MRTTKELALGLALVVLAACSSSNGSSTTSAATSPTSAPAMTPATTVASTSTSTSASTPSPASTPAIREWDGATFVTGTVRGFEIDQGLVETSGRMTSSHDGRFSYSLLSDDPRATGEVTGTWNTLRYGTNETDGALVQWGEATLTNDGGTWEGAWAGTMASPVGDMISRWWRGTGDYDGLTFFMWMQAKNVADPSTRWYGLIYEGDPPAGF